MNTIFKNKSRLSFKNLFFKVLFFGIIMGLIYLVKLVRNGYEELNPYIFIFFSVIIIVTLTLQALTEQIVIEIRIDKITKDLIISIQRQFKGYSTIKFNPEKVNFELKVIPSRAIPHERQIIFKDDQYKIRISTNDLGVNETDFELIKNELIKLYPNKMLS
jgi:hypothetical protein